VTLCSKNVERGPLRRERNDIIFLRAKSKAGDDDRWALNRELRSFEPKRSVSIFGKWSKNAS